MCIHLCFFLILNISCNDAYIQIIVLDENQFFSVPSLESGLCNSYMLCAFD